MNNSLAELKLNKPLTAAMIAAGYFSAKEIQLKVLPRIRGGESIWAIGPKGCGKSTAYVLASLQKVKVLEEIAPRVLVLVPDIESGEKIIDQYHIFNRNRDLRIMGLFAGPSLDAQVLELTDGVDIIVATPDRARASYLKLGLNLNKIQLFIVDDADEIVKKGLQLPTTELARGIRKAQFLIFSEVKHARLDKMVETFLEVPTVIEVEELEESNVKTTEQLLYQVPNFRTKLNLLQLLMQDVDVFDKVIITVQSAFTAETVYKELQFSREGEVLIYQQEDNFKLPDFYSHPQLKILVAIQNETEDWPILPIPCLINFDIPENYNAYLKNVLEDSITSTEKLVINFCTDLELSDIKKIEQLVGKRMQLIPLPEDLFIEAETPKKKAKQEEKNAEIGAAFHQKKASNSKTYNYSAREKVRLSGKISNKKHD